MIISFLNLLNYVGGVKVCKYSKLSFETLKKTIWFQVTCHITVVTCKVHFATTTHFGTSYMLQKLQATKEAAFQATKEAAK